MKIIKNTGEVYNSENESLRIDDSNSMMYDKSIFDGLFNLIPESFRNYNKYFNTLSILSSYIITKEINLLEDINNIYNPDKGSETIINFLADRYNIVFPISYNTDQKRLILKYYPNFIKIKGTESATRILDFIGRTEVDFYNSKPGKYEIEYYYEGYIKIQVVNDEDKERIKRYLKFSQTLLNRVTPAGMYSQIVIRSKNLIPYPYISTIKTKNGITFTDNGDGSITVNGTATANVGFTLAHNENGIVGKGIYHLTGCPSGGNYLTYNIQNRVDNSWEGKYYDIGNGVVLDVQISITDIIIHIRSGTTVNNLIFKPQLELGTTGTDYEQYYPEISI